MQCSVLRINMESVAAVLPRFSVFIPAGKAMSLVLCLALLLGPAAHAETPPSPSASITPVELGGNPAKLQGQGDSAILNWVLANSGPLKGETLSGEFRIAYTITPAEGWWEKAGSGKLAWH